MATLDLTTYSGLLDAVAKYLNRRDLNDQIPAFITQHEAKMNRELRVRDMQTRTDITYDGSGFANVPADFLSPDSMENVTGIGTYGADFKFVSEDEARKIRRGTCQPPQPTWYTIYGSEFEVFGGAADQLLRLRYYTSIPNLSFDTSSNWLLVKAPDLYIVGACLEAAIYLKNDDRLATWNAIRTKIMDDMRVESERALKPQGALTATRKSFG